ncbi:Predicted dithiol-disulfide isomerase, DsbA family [Flavobacterium segetis]|uniref:Predicted dithiol-disulfide isomerase, DsbA family n=1 Tax=Flavobacterium segetis TaxID=271157 RepID=A0A1M5FEC7_9FLAO|nr:DsbA family oxidoreductase [Flavobacterium segetis]SHF89907.1 Predicted dithiol-disulfide isomerase, DsbA family [Flavobacterium segetis]
MKDTLKIQIWSDIMCPFCYIGKRRIEVALENFPHKNSVEIEWKSFQLDAGFVASADDNMVVHLANKYQKDAVWAQGMLDDMTQNAKNSGLDFHFEKAIMANSLNAHRLLHLAKKFNLANNLEELLFKAYLTDGLNINDLATLKDLGVKIGLNSQDIDEVLNSDIYAKDVASDILEAQSIGVQGVPFYVFDNKYAVSGAQHVDTFINTLEKVWKEGNFVAKPIVLNTTLGDSCGIDGCN